MVEAGNVVGTDSTPPQVPPTSAVAGLEVELVRLPVEMGQLFNTVNVLKKPTGDDRSCSNIHSDPTLTNYSSKLATTIFNTRQYIRILHPE